MNLTDYMYPDNRVFESQCFACRSLDAWLIYVLMTFILYVQLHDENLFYFSLPFLFDCLFDVWFSPFAMIINLLM